MFLPSNIQEELRALNKINENEVLKKEGDLFVAVNVVSQQRRIVKLERELLERINKLSPLQSANKRVLKG